MKTKQVGIVFTTPPVNGMVMREAIDFILGIMDAYSQPYLFFAGDGVYHLLSLGETLDHFNCEKWFAWLVQYESFKAFVLRDDLLKRGFRLDDSFRVPIKAVAEQEWYASWNTCDWFFSA